MAPRLRWSVDLMLVGVLAALTPVALLVPGVPRYVEWALGVPFLVALPGYALVSALLPERPWEDRTVSARPRKSPGWPARAAVSLAVSAIVVAVVGVALSETVGIRLEPAVVSIAGVTVAGVAVALVRRSGRPPARRAAPASGLSLGAGGGTTLQAGVTALSLLALVAAVAYAGSAPAPTEPFSEAYLLAEDGDGDLVAEGYPTTFVAGEGHTLYVAIENHERRPTNYGVVVLAQRVAPNGSVVEERRLQRFDVQTAAGERAVVERTVAPAMVGERIRLQFLVYRGAVPDDPGADSAAFPLHLWVEVVEDTGAPA